MVANVLPLSLCMKSTNMKVKEVIALLFNQIKRVFFLRR
jgi:hypothetical protein